MKHHDYLHARIVQANNRIEKLLNVLRQGDELGFVEIVENEALTLHALMMSSEPGYMLLQPETISIIKKIKDFRARTSVPVSFTIDAGPNVHLLYPLKHRKDVLAFVASELLSFCENRKWIDDEAGKGPHQIHKP